MRNAWKHSRQIPAGIAGRIPEKLSAGILGRGNFDEISRVIAERIPINIFRNGV